MLTRDEVLQLILYLIIATVLLLGSRAGAKTVGEGKHGIKGPRNDKPDLLSGICSLYWTGAGPLQRTGAFEEFFSLNRVTSSAADKSPHENL
jgi:hypothetical protein